MSGATWIAFQGYVYCGGGDNEDTMGDVQTSEGGRGMDDNGGSEPPASSVNYGQQWHCEEISHHVWGQYKLLAALSSTESKVYRVQQKVHKQQLTFMGLWITVLPQYTELVYIFNATVLV
jgi:hypothetical protein